MPVRIVVTIAINPKMTGESKAAKMMLLRKRIACVANCTAPTILLSRTARLLRKMLAHSQTEDTARLNKIAASFSNLSK